MYKAPRDLASGDARRVARGCLWSGACFFLSWRAQETKRQLEFKEPGQEYSQVRGRPRPTPRANFANHTTLSGGRDRWLSAAVSAADESWDAVLSNSGRANARQRTMRVLLRARSVHSTLTARATDQLWEWAIFLRVPRAARGRRRLLCGGLLCRFGTSEGAPLVAVAPDARLCAARRFRRSALPAP